MSPKCKATIPPIAERQTRKVNKVKKENNTPGKDIDHSDKHKLGKIVDKSTVEKGFLCLKGDALPPELMDKNNIKKNLDFQILL